MAGRPKTRAKRALAEAAAETRQAAEAVVAAVQSMPEAVRRETPTQATVRARARELEPAPATTAKPLELGTETRRAIDHDQAERLRALMAALRPGHTLQIERLRPQWAAGWVEDYVLDDVDTLPEVRGYLRDEHGGSLYRLSVIAQGKVLYAGRMEIAGPPKLAGRVADRDAWEGVKRGGNVGVQPSSSSSTAQSDTAGMLGVLRLFFDQQKLLTESTIESARDMVRQGSEQTRELVTEIVKGREQGQRDRSLGAQLGELVEATRAVDRVRKVIGGPTQKAQQPDNPDEQGTMLQRAVNRAGEEFVTRAIMSRVAPQGGETTAAIPVSIREARPPRAGQPNGKP